MMEVLNCNLCAKFITRTQEEMRQHLKEFHRIDVQSIADAFWSKYELTEKEPKKGQKVAELSFKFAKVVSQDLIKAIQKQHEDNQRKD